LSRKRFGYVGTRRSGVWIFVIRRDVRGFIVGGRVKDIFDGVREKRLQVLRRRGRVFVFRGWIKDIFDFVDENRFQIFRRRGRECVVVIIKGRVNEMFVVGRMGIELHSIIPFQNHHTTYFIGSFHQATAPGQPQGLPVPYTERAWHKVTREACGPGLIFYACACQSVIIDDGIIYSRDVAIRGQ
jgi:hypothetical protein